MDNMPYIKLSGIFEFRSPVDKVVDNKKVYTIVALRSIQDLLDSGEEPYETIYSKIGLTEDRFNSDRNKDISVVTLVDEGNNYIYIPTSDIIKVPDSEGELYSNRLLVVDLGKLPNNLSLSQLKSAIADKILYGLNLTVEVKDVVNSATEVVNDLEHDMFMRSTVHGDSREDTYEDKYHKLTKEYDKLLKILTATNAGIKLGIRDETVKVTVREEV